MLIDTLQTDLSASLKSGDKVRVETLRFLIAGIRNHVTQKYGSEWEKKMTDADCVEIVKKQIKTHNESIEAFAKAGRQELVTSEQAQLAVLKEFAPVELGDDELKKILEPIAATGEKNFGLLMKQAMTTVGGKADGGRVASILKQLV